MNKQELKDALSIYNIYAKKWFFDYKTRENR